jgi:hypothetical protein
MHAGDVVHAVAHDSYIHDQPSDIALAAVYLK